MSSKKTLSATHDSLKRFCDENQINFEKLNSGYQIRLEGMIDVYPVNARWHNLRTGERGDWQGYKDLRRVMLAALEMIAAAPKPREETAIFVPEKDDYRLTQLTAEVVMTRWQYDSWLDRLLHRRTYYHKIRGREWAFKSNKGWFQPGKEEQ